MLTTKKLLIVIGVPLVGLLIVIGLAAFFIFGYNRSQVEGTPTPSPECNLKLVIDHDGGADDAMAITMALLYEKYFDGPEVVALTTTFGNVNESQSVINSERILNVAGRPDIPIFSGAKHALISGIESDYFFGHDGLGDDGYMPTRPIPIVDMHSALALIDLSKRYEGNLIVMAIGPVTNVALAIRLDPHFLSRLSQLYIGAGNIYSDAHPDAEFNAAMDPEAYYILSDNAAADKVTIVPYSQIKDSLNISKEWRVNVLGAIDTPLIKALNGFERISLAVVTEWNLLDPAVAAIVLHSPVVKEYKNATNGIILCGDERAINTNNFTSTNPNTRVLYSVINKTYKKLLIDIYSAELPV